MDFLLIGAFAGILSGVFVEGVLAKGRHVWLLRLIAVGLVFFVLWLVPMWSSMRAYDGYCYAFVGERWPCSFWRKLKNEAEMDLFLLLPLYIMELIFYTITSVVVWHWQKRTKK